MRRKVTYLRFIPSNREGEGSIRHLNKDRVTASTLWGLADTFHG